MEKNKVGKRDRDRRVAGRIRAGLLSVEVREVFTEKTTFEKIPERCKRVRYMDI